MPLTDDEIQQVVGTLAPAIQEYVDGKVEEIYTTMGQLGQQVDEMVAALQGFVVSKTAGSDELAGFIRDFWITAMTAQLDKLGVPAKPKPKAKGGE